MPKDGKPRGRMSSYAFFVQTCREEHKKKHPGEQVVFAEFSRKCSEKWKAMVGKEKKHFEDMAEKDRARYEQEMKTFQPGGKGAKTGGKRKRTKDPNAPKRSLSGFFFFCHEERGNVRAMYPSYGVGDIAKELGKRWEVCQNRPKFEAMAAKDKLRYEKDMAEYKAGGAKKAKVAAPAVAAAEDDDEDEEEEDEESD
jgi:hypothetical protein